MSKLPSQPVLSRVADSPIVRGHCVKGDVSLSYALKGQMHALSEEPAEEAEQRKELIERIDKGEHIELFLDAWTYAEGPGCITRRPVSFSLEGLQSFAKTAIETPLLHDHVDMQAFTVGYCQRSEAFESGGVVRLREGLVCNTPNGVKAVLLRHARKFSIGYWPDMDLTDCSVCGENVKICGHYMGQRVERDGELFTVKYVHHQVTAIERSFVTFPHADATGLIDWQQLSARLISIPAPRERTEENDVKIEDLAKRLGVTGDAEDIIKAHERLQAELDELRADDNPSKLSARITELEADKEKLTAERDELRAAKRQTECDALIESLAADGVITRGGGRESLLRKYYEQGRIDDVQELAGSYREDAPSKAKADEAKVEASPTELPEALRQRQSPAATALDGGEPATDTQQGTGEPNYVALFASLPLHIRELAGPKMAANPKRYFDLNPKQAEAVGLVTA